MSLLKGVKALAVVKKIKKMEELNANIARILDCLQDINRNIAKLGSRGIKAGRKRPRAAISSDSESETECECEEHTNVSASAPEADEDGARFCIKTHYDTPVLVVGEKPNGARMYQTLIGTGSRNDTRSRARDVVEVSYSSERPVLDEDDLPEGETLVDTDFVDDGSRRGFLNPVSNRVFRIVPRCQDRDYQPMKDVFLAPAPEAPDFMEKKYLVLLNLQSIGADLTFGTKSNQAASDEMHHMLVIDHLCQKSKRLSVAKDGYLCDACNLRRKITHTWDDSINLGKNCAAKVDFISEALSLVPRTKEAIDAHGEALFARFIAHAESNFTVPAADS